MRTSNSQLYTGFQEKQEQQIGARIAACSGEKRGTFEFIPIKSLAATGSGVPGSWAGHSRSPSPDRGYPSSTGEVGL
jgi:hypothetical protein